MAADNVIAKAEEKSQAGTFPYGNKTNIELGYLPNLFDLSWPETYSSRRLSPRSSAHTVAGYPSKCSVTVARLTNLSQRRPNYVFHQISEAHASDSGPSWGHQLNDPLPKESAGPGLVGPFDSLP